jgi:hypothetical protein
MSTLELKQPTPKKLTFSKEASNNYPRPVGKCQNLLEQYG